MNERLNVGWNVGWTCANQKIRHMKHVIFHPTFHQTCRKNVGWNVGLVCSGHYGFTNESPKLINSYLTDSRGLLTDVDISIRILRYLLQFIYSCQLPCYYYHHFLIHGGGRGDFVTFWRRKSQNHCLNLVWIAYATTTETYTRWKSGWIEEHYHQTILLKKSYASVVVIDDSIVAGIGRYQQYGEISFYKTKLKTFYGTLTI